MKSRAGLFGIPGIIDMVDGRGETIRVNAILRIVFECIVIYCHIAIFDCILVKTFYMLIRV